MKSYYILCSNITGLQYPPVQSEKFNNNLRPRLLESTKVGFRFEIKQSGLSKDPDNNGCYDIATTLSGDVSMYQSFIYYGTDGNNKAIYDQGVKDCLILTLGRKDGSTFWLLGERNTYLVTMNDPSSVFRCSIKAHKRRCNWSFQGSPGNSFGIGIAYGSPGDTHENYMYYNLNQTTGNKCILLNILTIQLID